MADRRVSVKLEADVSNYTSGLAKAAAATKALGDNATVKVDADISSFMSSLAQATAAAKTFGANIEKTVDRDLQPVMDRAGRNSGGKLAQGINAGLIRNSPLIAAGVAGALTAGAPVALAGAAMLFGGIGAFAAKSSQEVSSAWKSLGAEVSAGVVSDASVLFPALAGMADDLGDSFDRLRPQLRAAFEATAPLVETFTAAVTGAAENAMPGLVDAVQSAQPVMAGFQSFMESVGTGVGDMFSALAEHAPAAGRAFDALGDIVGELLPVIGELLGNGVELASVILPPLAAALGQVTSVVQALGPLLPAIVAGFAGMKIADSLAGGLGKMSGGLSTLAQNAAFATYSMDGFAGSAAGRVSGAASTTSRSFASMSENIGKASAALPALGIVLGGISSNLSNVSSEEDRWAQAILAGGHAAQDAYTQYRDGTHFGQAIDEATGLASSWDDAKAKADELRAQMDPLQLAQSNVTASQNALRDAVDKFGPSSLQAKNAADDYRMAQEEVERQEGETELAISGVTQAMIDQYNQSIAATDSAFAYRDSQNAVEDASAALADVQAHLGDVNEDTRTTTEDVQRAGLDLEEALYRQATAAGKLASDALPATATELDRNTASAQGTLAELYRMRDQMGTAFPASLQTTISNLEKTGVKVDGTSDKFGYLGDQVNAVPDNKDISVNADTGPAENTLAAFLGKNRTLTLNVSTGAGTGGSGGTAKRLAVGGPVQGPGTGTSDSIPAYLSNGEYVVKASSVSKYGVDFMDKVNAGHFASGGLVGFPGVLNPLSTTVNVTMDERAVNSMQKAADSLASVAGPAGAGSAGGGWMGLWNMVKAAIPQARINSTYRPGAPDAHGRNKAIDFGFGSGPGGNGSAGLAAINRLLHDRVGANLYELIYDGIGDDRPDLKNGRPLTYNAATRAQHHNHVHAAVYHDGVDSVPQTGFAYLEKGEAVIPASLNSREFSGGGGGGSWVGGSTPVTLNLEGATISGTFDMGSDGLVRLVDGRVDSALATVVTGAQRR